MGSIVDNYVLMTSHSFGFFVKKQGRLVQENGVPRWLFQKRGWHLEVYFDVCRSCDILTRYLCSCCHYVSLLQFAYLYQVLFS